MDAADYKSRVIASFGEAMAAAGINPPDDIIPDGKLHRFPTNGQRDDDAGWYVLFLDGIPAGAFGDWRSDVSQAWCSLSPSHMTEAEYAEHRNRIATLKRYHAEEKRRRHAEASARARKIWEAAAPATDAHPYLSRKRVHAHGLRVDDDNWLIVPVLGPDGALWSLAFIAADGDKQFLRGGRIGGGVYLIGDVHDVLVITEGYATGASIHEATGHAVAVAFSVGNLLPVAQALRGKYADIRIVIAGDHDEHGVGQAKARKAAEAIGGLLAIPETVGDWNDVQRTRGPEIVRAAMRALLDQGPLKTEHTHTEAGASKPGQAEGEPTSSPTPAPSPPSPPHLSDLGNAARLVARHGQDLHHCPEIGWLVYTGTRWEVDHGNVLVGRYAEQTIKALYTEAAALTDKTDREKLVKHALQSEAEKRIQAMLAAAERGEGIPLRPEQLDADGWLLNCLNGTLDLRTGELRPHRREDLLTKLVPWPYDPQAPCPEWEAFLSEIMNGDKAMVRYLQCGLGYSLTGDTSEQVLFIPWGLGMNGKTTLFSAFKALIGDYGTSASAELFLVKRHDDESRHEFADLHGARFVWLTECESGRHLKEAVVKSITGGDPIRARQLYQKGFVFTPTAKVWMPTNHKPVFRGTDHAIRRRLKIIPFAVRIPDDKQDKELGETLKSELSGVLRWCVEGCLSWRREGLGEPDPVKEATGTYLDEMDTLKEFLAERCVLEAGATATAKELYEVYTDYCQQSGENPMTKKALGLALGERGLTSRRTNKAYFWRGVRLRLPTDPDGPADGEAQAPEPARPSGQEDAEVVDLVD
jgi:P4 family phage/plasmid primase-like protien